MLEDVRQALARTRATLWRDLLGVSALGVAFVSLLHMAHLLPV